MYLEYWSLILLFIFLEKKVLFLIFRDETLSLPAEKPIFRQNSKLDKLTINVPFIVKYHLLPWTIWLLHLEILSNQLA